MIFCLDFACLTRLAYVPAEAINLEMLVKVQVRSGSCVSLLDVSDLLLLFVVGLHLVDLVLRLRSDVG
jgi:hypothetical protein